MTDIFDNGVVGVDDYEECWNTGIYDDQYCYECPHRDECSGSNDEID